MTKTFSDFTPGGSGWKRCLETHPVLRIGKAQVYGGSCSTPIVRDARIYVGLDMSMRSNPKAYPWEEGEWFLYPITDMQPPSDVESFKKLIDWLAQQTETEQKIHIGCIGGHGRTGTVLTALVRQTMGITDAIQWVRSNYCKKAVETSSQVDFLIKHYGVSKVEPTKLIGPAAKDTPSWQSWGEGNYVRPRSSGQGARFNEKYASTEDAAVQVKPFRQSGSIWKRFDKR